VNVEPGKFNDGDVERLAELELKRGVKPELVKADERVASIRGYRNAFDLCRRPDSQAATLCLHAVDERHVEAIQLDAGVKAVLESFNNAGAEKRLGAVQKIGSDTGQDDEKKQQADRGPFENRMQAPER
jgi:hypothetical protein